MIANCQMIAYFFRTGYCKYPNEPEYDFGYGEDSEERELKL